MLTQERLKEVLKYDPETGLFIWIEKSGTRCEIGAIAGYTNDSGYIVISVDGRKYRAHQLAWLYMTGEFPNSQIDHENRIRDDNRWFNLRVANQTEQNANCKIRKNNTSGYRGVYFDRIKDTWYVQVQKEGICYFGGYHLDIESAAKAQEKLAIELFGEFYNAKS